MGNSAGSKSAESSPVISRPYENLLHLIKISLPTHTHISYRNAHYAHRRAPRPERRLSISASEIDSLEPSYDSGLNPVESKASNQSLSECDEEGTSSLCDRTTDASAQNDRAIYSDLHSTLGSHYCHNTSHQSKLGHSIFSDANLTLPVFGCPTNHKCFLEPQIFQHFYPFIMDESILTCLGVCPHWFITIYSYLQQLSAPIVDQFKSMYQDHLHLVTSTFSFQPLYTASSHQIRIDLLIYAKVLSKCQNQTTEIGYSYHYQHSSELKSAIIDQTQIFNPECSSYNHQQTKRYTCLYRFEGQKKRSKRHVWFERDMCRFHGDELMIASIPTVPQINTDDVLEIAVNLSNAFGMIDLDQIAWFQPHYITDLEERNFGKSSKVDAAQHYWISLDAFQPFTTDRLELHDYFGPQWTHLSTEFAGVDITYSRSRYRASALGEVPDSVKRLGIEIIVKRPESAIVYPLTRLGLQHDRFTTQQLRRGDLITVYTSQGGGSLM